MNDAPERKPGHCLRVVWKELHRMPDLKIRQITRILHKLHTPSNNKMGLSVGIFGIEASVFISEINNDPFEYLAK